MRFRNQCNQGIRLITVQDNGWYEMFYRGYDPALGRMLQVDPYASSFASQTPYNYALNSPGMINDPSGGYVKLSNDFGRQQVDKFFEYGWAFDFTGEGYSSSSSATNRMYNNALAFTYQRRLAEEARNDPDKLQEYGNLYRETNVTILIQQFTGEVSDTWVADDGNTYFYRYFETKKLGNQGSGNGLEIFNSGNYKDNYDKAEAYMREQSRMQNRLVVALGLSNGIVAVLPTEGKAYRGRKKTNQYVENGDSYANFNTNLIKSKGSGKDLKVKVLGEWHSVNDVLVSIPDLDKYHIQLSLSSAAREYLIPFSSNVLKAKNMGAETLTLFYNRTKAGKIKESWDVDTYNFSSIFNH